MRKYYLFFIALMLVASVVNAADRYSVATGNWSSTGTWSATSGGASGATAPVAGDNVFIEGGFTVTVSSTVACTNLTVGTATNGFLVVGNSGTVRTITVSGNVSIASTGSITISNNTATHSLIIGGNLSNAGIFDMQLDGNSNCNVTFNGAANQTVSGTGATTEFNGITINNTGGVNDNIVEVTASNFTTAVDFLTLTDGILKLSGTFAFSNDFFSAGSYNINANSGLWLNNPNVTITGQGGSPNIDGSIRITAGTYNVGNSAGNSLDMDNGSSFTMEGGTMNIAARFQAIAADAITFNMSNGTLNLVTVSTMNNTNRCFQISSASSSFTMSGGTIVIEEANTGTGGDYENLAGTVSITGGTVQFGNANTGSGTVDDFDIIGASQFPSFAIVDNGTSVPTVTLGSGITLIGGLTINSGTSLLANGQSISLTGSLTNNGTFTLGTQTTTFNGAAAQTIGGTTATAFSSLTINNTTGGVALSQDISVAGTMTFTSGVVTSSSTNTLTINDGATVTGASNASYVDGQMSKRGNDNFTFPVGDPLGSYHPCRLDNTGGANGDEYIAEYFRGPALSLSPGGIAAGSGLYAVSHCEYWRVGRVAGAADVTVEVSWTTDSPCPTPSTPYVTSLTGIRLAWLDLSNEWNIAPGTPVAASGGTGAGFVSNSAIASIPGNFTYFTLGNVEANQNPLPVKIGSIKAYEKANGVQLDWTAFTEINLDKYIIERSADGRHFTAIGDVAAFNSPNESRYGFFDPSPLAGVSFYRLRNLDIDGRSDYSKIVRVDLGGKGGLINVYPNPAPSGTFISYNGNLAKGNYTARIFNASGQQVWVQKFSHSGGAINQTIQLPASVRPGMHNLQLDNEGTKVATRSFMVQ